METPAPIATNAYWMRLKLPRARRMTTIAAAMAAARSADTPKSPSAAATPANSATVVPMFATSIVRTANAVQRTPNRSRMRPASP